MLIASTSEVYGDPEVHPQPETYWGHVNPIGGYFNMYNKTNLGFNNGNDYGSGGLIYGELCWPEVPVFR